jgi:ATPase subunit of ABC transporter with duplicated ATPase domains
MISDAVASMRAAIRSSEKSLAAAAQGLDAALLELVRAKGAIEQAHVPQEMAFRAVIEKQQQNQAQSVERAKLEKQQNDLLFKQRRHEEVVSQLKTLKNRRDELLARLSEERDMRFKVRDSVAERLNSRLKPHIRVSIAQNADPDDYRKFLENNLRGLGIQQNRVAASISKAISPQELGELVQAGETASLARRGGINVQQSGSVIKAFNSEERLMDLQILDMDDYPSIELCDNGVYKPSTGLSTGQKCTAILPLLMFDSVNPLLIDQPEDNLDNRFVYEAIVSSVNDVKHMRQLIFVTHNPNIPVLGDASKVVVMQSDGRTGSARLEGNVDECRAEIINLLEGGADAFRLRSERYQTTKP